MFKLVHGSNKSEAHFTLGVKAKVELKSSIPVATINKISPKCFTLGVKAEKENNFFNLPLYALTWPQGRKTMKPCQS